jgi:hypothetical protein
LILPMLRSLEYLWCNSLVTHDDCPRSFFYKNLTTNL